MRNRPRNIAAWGLAFLVLSQPAAAVELAKPDAYAGLPAPNSPKPPLLEGAKGFGVTLDPYRDLLSGEERQAFQRFSEELLQGRVGDVAKRAAAKIKQGQDRARAGNEPYQMDESAQLFTYTIPNDPLLMLGTAKSYVGPVTTPPRLKKGAFDPPKRDARHLPEGIQVAPDDDNWIFNEPAKICTRGLSFGLEMRSVYSDIENFPIADGSDATTLMNLTQIERMPNPIILADNVQDGPNEAVNEKDDDGRDIGDETPRGPETPQDVRLLPTRRDRGPDRAFPDLSKKDMPLAEFIPAFRKHLGGDEGGMGRIAGELTALAAMVPDQRKRCQEAHGKFREVHWADAENLSLFSCEVAPEKMHGLGARMTSEGGQYFPSLSLYVEDAPSHLGVELDIHVAQQKIVLQAFKNDDYFGPEVQWNGDGQPMMLDFILPAAVAAKYGEYDVYEWHENGKLKFLGHRKAGKKAAIEQSWYASGALAGEVRFDDAGRPTTYKEWYENKRPAEDTVLVDGEMNGTRRWWHTNGQPAGEVGYDKGRPTGAFALWYEDGRLGTKGTFQNGQLEGKLTWLFEDGGTLYEGSFVKGLPNGPQRVYKPDGRMLSEKGFKAGEPEGGWQTFDKNGKVISDTTFAKGQKTGHSVVHYPNGQVFLDMPFQEGLIDGPAKSFFKDGQLAATCVYEKDRLASFIRYYPTGEPQLEGKILDAETGTGEFTALTKDGRQTLSCQLRDRMTRDCKVFGESGDELAFPSDSELVKTAKAVGKKPLTWQPNRCGGAEKQLNVDMVADAQGKEIFLNYAAKGACEPGAAGRLACMFSVEKDRINLMAPCQLEAYDEGSDLERIIQEMDGATVH